MKVYLVAASSCNLVGAAFVKEYAGRILIAGCTISALPPVSMYLYNKGS